MAYVIQIVRKIKLSVPQLIHTYLFTMLHTISIVNLTLKLNFDGLTPTIFFLTFTTEWYINIDCVSESFFSNTFKCLLQAESSMTGRVYIGEMLIQIWLKSMKK